MKIDFATLNNDAKSKGKAEALLPFVPIESKTLLDAKRLF